jgi:oxygen-independent coproporphyrinogen-3 oxidase
MTSRRISLYVHVPFCRRRCAYCTFYHVSLGDGAIRRAFVDAVLVEYDSAASEIGEPFTIPTIFLGGGTPSVIGCAEIGRILERARPMIAREGAEATIELNPEDVGGAFLDELKSLGFNRVSLGVQSMDDRAQRTLGRCPPRTNQRALELVSARFENYSADLLLGIPSSSVGDLRRTLEAIGSFAPPHLSLYCLEPGGDIAEPSREFFQRVDVDRCAEEYLLACEVLESAGYAHYEISNFARPGRECAHNLVYWRGGEYLGLGPGAHSYVVGRRFHNAPSLSSYLGRADDLPWAVRVEDPRGEAQERLEELMLGLRTSEGIPLAALPRGAAALEDFVQEGLARREGVRVRLTDRGYLLLNDVVHRLTGNP